MSSTDADQRVRESIEAFNRADWDAIRGFSDPGLVYEETGSGRRIEGVEAVVEALQAWRAALPDATGEITRLLVDGDTSVVEIVWRGTQTGTLATPGGEIPPTGRPIEMWASMWQRWKNDRVVHERHHLDVLAMLAQLGALPAPASPGAGGQ